jgi:D-tyrosyl-tRNA(Tyr) deacylase
VRAVVQRVRRASVSVDGPDGPVPSGEIGEGLLVYLGVARGDVEADADRLADRITGMRILDDDSGRMNLSIRDPGTGGSVLVVSQFTLMGDASRGRRPSWEAAAPPEAARVLYERLITKIRDLGVPCESGEFRARMTVSCENAGPVTILLDSAG